MTALEITRAPPPSIPLRFLLSTPIWGMVAAGWIAWHGSSVLVSRWAMPTVALVHLFILGVLGNAMLGSLVQFLPVAAGSTFASTRTLSLLHVTFNAGLALLVTAMTLSAPTALLVAAALLACSLVTFGALALHALYRGRGARWLRGAIALALSWLLATAMLGALLAAALSGHMTLPQDRLVDVHAATGLLGWVLLLMASVGCVTMPMFQGTRPVPGHVLWAWLLLATLGLLVGAMLRLSGSTFALAAAVATPALLLTAASLGLQWHARHRRNRALTLSWACGTIAIAAACILLLTAPFNGAGHRDVLIGVLAIGIGLPLMLLAMLMEIVAGWQS